MIIDAHTHVGLYGRHFGREFAEETLKLGGFPGLTAKMFRKTWNISLREYMAQMNEAGVERSVAVAIDITRITDSRVPDDYVYSVVRRYPKRLIGFSGIQPIDVRGRLNAQALKDLEKAVVEYGFRGMKLLPTYSHYSLNDRKVYPFYQKAQEYGISVLMHIGASAQSFGSMQYSRPYMLKDVGWDFPDLKICVAHMGYPWTEELLATMRMQPNIYADISALHARPTILTWNLVMAKEYGVLNRIMFGSDYPATTSVKKCVEWCRSDLNRIVKKAGWPTFSQQEIDGLLGENAKRFLNLK